MSSTPRSRPAPDGPNVTKTGKVLTDDDILALAEEAEMGYDTRTGDSVAKILTNTTDASVWAHHFKDQFGTVAPDEATMLTWFANAIETGRAEGRKELCPHEAPLQLSDHLYCCKDCGFLLQERTLEEVQEESFTEGFREGRA